MVVIGPWVGFVTEPWVELVIELQVVMLFGSAISVVVLILSLVTVAWVVVATGAQILVVAEVQPWTELAIEP